MVLAMFNFYEFINILQNQRKANEKENIKENSKSNDLWVIQASFLVSLSVTHGRCWPCSNI